MFITRLAAISINVKIYTAYCKDNILKECSKTGELTTHSGRAFHFIVKLLKVIIEVILAITGTVKIIVRI